MQNNLVRGPPKKAGTANDDFSQHADIQEDTNLTCSRSVCHPQPELLLVILNVAGGGVKDLKHHTGLYFGFPRQPLRCLSE